MYTQTTPNRHNKGDAVYTMSLKKIQKSGSDKDTTWLGFKNYVPALLDDLRQGKANSHRTRSSNASIQAIIGEISEGHLQSESE